MNGLDLFSGIGGITKALEGYVIPVAYCENDRYAQGVLLSRMATGDLPLAPIWDDVRSLTGAMLPTIDIIYGGFPCQDISVAGGNTKGLDGERSGLFFEIVRLARETGAPWIFLENVPGIRTKGLGRVLQELDQLGYDCRWGFLSAADVGANHKRERWFLLAHAKGIGLEKSENAGGKPTGISSVQRSTVKLGGPSDAMADTDDTGQRITLPGRAPQDGSAGTLKGSGWWAIEPNVGRVAHGIPARVDRLRALGNAVVPLQAREAFEKLVGLKP